MFGSIAFTGRAAAAGRRLALRGGANKTQRASALRHTAPSSVAGCGNSAAVGVSPPQGVVASPVCTLVHHLNGRDNRVSVCPPQAFHWGLDGGATASSLFSSSEPTKAGRSISTMTMGALPTPSAHVRWGSRCAPQAGSRFFATFGRGGSGDEGTGSSVWASGAGNDDGGDDDKYGNGDEDGEALSLSDADEDLFGSDWESEWESDGEGDDEGEGYDSNSDEKLARQDRMADVLTKRAGMDITERERLIHRWDLREEIQDMEAEYLGNKAKAEDVYRKNGLSDVPYDTGSQSVLIDPAEYLAFARRRQRALRQAGVKEPGSMPKELSRIEKLPDDSFFTRLIEIGSSSVTRRGGRVQSFRALLVLGNARGSAGFGFGKGATIADAMQDATMKAYRDLVTIPLYEDRTLYHDVLGRHNNAKVMFRRARPGYGLKAGPVINAICDSFGLRDCVTKVYGSKNKYTVVHAAFKAFAKYNSMEQVALRRGQRLRDVNKLVEERYANNIWKNWPDNMEDVPDVRAGKVKTNRSRR